MFREVPLFAELASFVDRELSTRPRQRKHMRDVRDVAAWGLRSSAVPRTWEAGTCVT